MDVDQTNENTLSLFIKYTLTTEIFESGIASLQNEIDTPLNIHETIHDMGCKVILYCKQMHYFTTWEEMKWVRKQHQYISIPLSQSGKPEKLEPQNLQSLQKLYDYFGIPDQHRPDFLGPKKKKYEPLAAPVLTLGKLPNEAWKYFWEVIYLYLK
jgi:hypothetical protein